MIGRFQEQIRSSKYRFENDLSKIDATGEWEATIWIKLMLQIVFPIGIAEKKINQPHQWQ